MKKKCTIYTYINKATLNTFHGRTIESQVVANSCVVAVVVNCVLQNFQTGVFLT